MQGSAALRAQMAQQDGQLQDSIEQLEALRNTHSERVQVCIMAHTIPGESRSLTLYPAEREQKRVPQEVETDLPHGQLAQRVCMALHLQCCPSCSIVPMRGIATDTHVWCVQSLEQQLALASEKNAIATAQLTVLEKERDQTRQELVLLLCCLLMPFTRLCILFATSILP